MFIKGFCCYCSSISIKHGIMQKPKNFFIIQKFVNQTTAFMWFDLDIDRLLFIYKVHFICTQVQVI